MICPQIKFEISSSNSSNSSDLKFFGFKEFLSSFIHPSFSYSNQLFEFFCYNSGYFVLETGILWYRTSSLKAWFYVKKRKNITKKRLFVKIPDNLSNLW